jgi:hypothetical protein
MASDLLVLVKNHASDPAKAKKIQKNKTKLSQQGP